MGARAGEASDAKRNRTHGSRETDLPRPAGQNSVAAFGDGVNDAGGAAAPWRPHAAAMVADSEAWVADPPTPAEIRRAAVSYAGWLRAHGDPETIPPLPPTVGGIDTVRAVRQPLDLG